jgi:hypothetical protein
MACEQACTMQATPNRGLRLHSGVATENILDGYINAIKVLQKIDANGILLMAVTLPIKIYLRSRPDTIRCVVKMLTQVCQQAWQGTRSHCSLICAHCLLDAVVTLKGYKEFP